jgi:hypothetical protein
MAEQPLVNETSLRQQLEEERGLRALVELRLDTALRALELTSSRLVELMDETERMR